MKWNDFFEALSLCYFGPVETLAALLFALYDQELEMRLSCDQLEELLS
jgi:hypothetical protein